MLADPCKKEAFQYYLSQVQFLNMDEHEYFEERAAIMEYDGGLNREEAERLALECLEKRRGFLRLAG